MRRLSLFRLIPGRRCGLVEVRAVECDPFQPGHWQAQGSRIRPPAAAAAAAATSRVTGAHGLAAAKPQTPSDVARHAYPPRGRLLFWTDGQTSMKPRARACPFCFDRRDGCFQQRLGFSLTVPALLTSRFPLHRIFAPASPLKPRKHEICLASCDCARFTTPARPRPCGGEPEGHSTYPGTLGGLLGTPHDSDTRRAFSTPVT